MDKISASEALYAFCAWLTCREERTVLSATDDAGTAAELIKEFSDLNDLDEPRPGWDKRFVMPSPAASQ